MGSNGRGGDPRGELLTEGAFRCIKEVEEVDLEIDAGSVAVGHSLNLALDTVAIWQASHIGDPAGVVFSDGGVAELARGLAESKARQAMIGDVMIIL
jgi:hypothetical protein